MGYAPDSTQSGYLGPTDEMLQGDPFDDFLQEVVVGITNLPPELVRPRWQPQPPTTPAVNVDWCAIGVMSIASDFEPWVNHFGMEPEPGEDVLQRMERLVVLASFYGPDAQTYAMTLRDGIYIDQNRAAFRANAVGIIEIDDIVRNAELFREQWRNRSDLNMHLRREVRRIYQVRNLLRATGPIIANSQGTRTVTVQYDTAGLGGPPPAVGVSPTVWDDSPDGPTVWDYGETEWR